MENTQLEREREVERTNKEREDVTRFRDRKEGYLNEGK